MAASFVQTEMVQTWINLYGTPELVTFTGFNNVDMQIHITLGTSVYPCMASSVAACYLWISQDSMSAHVESV